MKLRVNLTWNLHFKTKKNPSDISENDNINKINK